ncbi:hypothetical protein T439DRAFT_325433 [Meredithblackwellia eburnea MCA 4105]
MTVITFNSTEERVWSFPVDQQPPSTPTIDEDGTRFSVKTKGKTDWWRTTTEWRSTGPAYTFNVAKDIKDHPEEELVASVSIEGDWKVQYDQAALFFRLSDSLWFKTGIEFEQGKAWASAVITNRWSDWSLLPIPIQATLPLRFTFKLKGAHLRIFLGKDMIREVNGFAHDVTEEELSNATLGVMGCSPIGPGTDVRFERFEYDWVKGDIAH